MDVDVDDEVVVVVAVAVEVDVDVLDVEPDDDVVLVDDVDEVLERVEVDEEVLLEVLVDTDVDVDALDEVEEEDVVVGVSQADAIRILQPLPHLPNLVFSHGSAQPPSPSQRHRGGQDCSHAKHSHGPVKICGT